MTRTPLKRGMRKPQTERPLNVSIDFLEFWFLIRSTFFHDRPPRPHRSNCDDHPWHHSVSYRTPRESTTITALIDMSWLETCVDSCSG